MNNGKIKTHLVIGASGGIATSVIKRLLDSSGDDRVVCISRSPDSPFLASHNARVEWIQSDNSEHSMETVSDLMQQQSLRFDRVFICNGILHGAEIFPEKQLQDVNANALVTLFTVNAIQPVLWLKHLIRLLPKDKQCVVTVFSARVGSIADNQLGGWYGYRASKAAQNMLLKTAAIECRRFAKNIKFLAFHPGTTDTHLSAPFQKGLPAAKLFRPEFVAEKLLNLIENLPDEPALNFLDWDGKAVAW